MAIRMVPDVVAPLTVTAIDLIGESVAPTWSNWLTYGMAGIGYIGAGMGWGGDFVKNIGVAAFPLAAKRIYDSVRGGASSRASSRLSYRAKGKVSRYPGPALETPFQGVKLT